MFTTIQLQKGYRRQRTLTIVGAVVLAAALGLLIMALLKTVNARKQVRTLYDLNSAGDTRSYQLCYVDSIELLPFASNSDTITYYISHDGNALCIVSINDSDVEYFQKLFADDSLDKVRIFGYSYPIPAELKPFAIDTFNEETDSNLTLQDHDSVFGMMYLQAHTESSIKSIGSVFDVAGGYMVASIFMALIGIILGVTGAVRLLSYSRIPASMGITAEQLDQEASRDSAAVYDNAGVILTDHYLISCRDRLKIWNYDDILWAYITAHRTNGIPDYNYLVIADSFGKTDSIASGNSFGKKNKGRTENMHSEILHGIFEHNQQVMFGYTRENQQSYRNMTS